MAISEEERNHRQKLRKRAEDALQGKQVNVEDLSSEDVQFLLHELQVHQAELAIQNEELRHAQNELEISRDAFADLYNLAPAGYCTVDRKDRILEANQTVATMLGHTQKSLINQPLSHYVARDDQDKYYLYRRRAFENHQVNARELRLIRRSGEPVFVRLESILAHDGKDRLMLMLIDISSQHELQLKLIEQREKERQKIARDLHDGPVQALSAIMFALRGIVMDHPGDELTKALEPIQAGLREQIQALRSFSMELRPPILAHLGLEMAIRSYVENFSEHHPQLRVRLALHPVGTGLPEPVSLALFRICQEALQNAFKHADRSELEVLIRLEQVENYVSLEINDNGEGFDQPENWFDFVQAGHLGLVGMRERAEAVGGLLEVHAARGQGTKIKAVVPIQV